MRHNVHSKELKNEWDANAVNSGTVTIAPQRLIEWAEP